MKPLSLWSLCLSLFVFGACIRSKPKPLEHNPAFDAYFSAYTHGEISKHSAIRLRFAEDMTEQTGPLPQDGLLRLEPYVAGDLSWEDRRTLLFSPHKALPSGQIFTGYLALERLVKDLPKDLAVFPFQFKVRDQKIRVSPVEGLAWDSSDEAWWQVQGRVELTDASDLETVAKGLRLNDGSKTLPLHWEAEGPNRYRFRSDSLSRSKDRPRALLATYDGSGLGSTDENQTLSLEVPQAGNFQFLKAHIHVQTEQYVVLEFSERLDPMQNLEGLISLNGKAGQYSIEGNRIKIFPKQKMLGAIKIEIQAALRNAKGQTLSAPTTTQVTLSEEKPRLRWIGKGNILPRAKSMPIHFQTINLDAVDVRVIKIKEDNVLQFFQVNQIDGDAELKRVGKVVLEKRISLKEGAVATELGDWTSHALDLASLLEPEAGAIYEIALGFRPSYRLYPCAPEGQAAKTEDKNMLSVPKDWDKPTYEYSYWDDFGEAYEYEDLDNPCKTAYYRADKAIKRNILGSDLGILAKAGDRGRLYVVNNLHTTEPMAGVELLFYDYQHDLIAKVETDAQGMAKPELSKDPFILVAKHGKQRGYLRLDEGSALSFSRFDVDGVKTTAGLKGFLYAERGVWRPGDEIFLHFILEDKQQYLPANHPIELEVKDPRGALFLKRNLNLSAGLNGFYNLRFSTPETAPTGVYTATVKIGGASFSQRLRIETIKPNRLKVAWQGEKTINTPKAKLNLQATWLHGAVAQGLKVKVDATLRQGQSKFPNLPDFIFFDPGSSYYGETRTVFEGQLNQEGLTTVGFEVEENVQNREPLPGPMRLELATQVFEPSGDFSIDQTDLVYHPYSTYVGLRLPQGDAKRGMLLTDTKHKIEIRSVNTQGQAQGGRKLSLKLYKLEWKWWYDSDRNSVPAWRGDVQAEAIQTAELKTDGQGRASWDLEIKYPEWGRYLVRIEDEQGHATGQVLYLDWPGWAGRSNEKDPEGAAMLELSSDKEVYAPGEEIQLNIPTGFEGRALVSIESGSRILQADWIQAQKGTVRYRFKADGSMAPNIYAHVTLLQPHAQTKNDLPIRMYGILPIRVENPQTRLEPVAQIPKECKPNERFSIAVSERKGGPMTYTLAIVDEGLLDLTRFKTPNPWSHFYQRIALGVRTWDMYGSVIAAYGGQVKSMLSIGGDMALNPDAIKQQDRFKPVVLFAGPFELGKDGKNTHEFTMPNYVGSVRVMVVAAQTQAGAYGQSEQTMPVRQDLMVLAGLPRVISVGEKLRLPVSVFTGKDELKEVSLSLEADGQFFNIQGGDSRKLNFQRAGEDMAFFEIDIKERLGKGKIKVQAKSGQASAYYEAYLEVRYPNQIETQSQALRLDKELSLNYQALGLAGTNSGGFEVSLLPPLNLQKRLDYLLRYPYGCAEQTTSAAFPQLYVGKLIDLPKARQDSIDKHIEIALARLRTYQNSNGGFGYWPGNNSQDFASNYLGHFILEAQKAGYKIPQGMLDSWLSYQTKQSQAWNLGQEDQGQEALNQAYRLYLLALAGKPELSAMNRLRNLKNIKDEPQPLRWHLAAAYFLAGQKDLAKQIAQTALFREKLNFTALQAQKTYGSPLRDQALTLQVLSLLGEWDKAASVLNEISKRLASEDWLATQETAQALIAIAQYAQQQNNQAWSFEYSIDQGNWQSVQTSKPLFQLDWQSDKAQTIRLRSKQTQGLYLQFYQAGLAKIGQESEINQGLSLEMSFKDINGKALSVDKIKQGTEFLAEIKIQNKTNQDLRDLALHQVFPSGWEIINPRITGRNISADAADYQDFRDDRVYTFFALEKAKTKTFRILLNAAYVGRYYFPATAVHAMYDKSVQAQRKGQWVEVQNPKPQ